MINERSGKPSTLRHVFLGMSKGMGLLEPYCIISSTPLIKHSLRGSQARISTGRRALRAFVRLPLESISNRSLVNVVFITGLIRSLGGRVVEAVIVS